MRANKAGRVSRPAPKPRIPVTVAVSEQAKALGVRLREARLGAEFSVKEAAEHIGVDRQTMYRWEWGASEPSLPTLRALAKLYWTTVGWIVNGE